TVRTSTRGARAMPPINVTPLGALPDAPRPQTPAAQPGSKPLQPITGKVYALKDGSGYAALASDGHYYRVDTGRGHGLTFSRAGGFVDVAMVDVAHGPVKTAEARSEQDANTTADVIGPDPHGDPMTALTCSCRGSVRASACP